MPTSAWMNLEQGEGEPDWGPLEKEYKACMKTFLLHVESWNNCMGIQVLEWKNVRYNSNRDAVDSRGVYAFVLDARKHSPSPIPPLSFVLYIGETGNSGSGTLKKRLKEYRNKKSQRHRSRVYAMLERWGDSLQFYYAVVENRNCTKECETKLLDSLLPPVNKADFSATVSNARDAALG